MGSNLFLNFGEAIAMILFGIGFANLMFQKNLIKKIIGFNIMDTAIYLFLAEKGYNLFRGKQGRGKTVILIIAVIFGVIVGNFGSDVIYLVQMIASGELVDYVYADIPLLMLVVMLEDPEYLMYIVKNLVLGLLFAGLGVWSQMRRVKAEVSGVKVTDLK